ncbi:MAG: FeoB-associated Cys-rich membrane protein [Prevotella sp.]|nr:FeoB-associated Cys-rich membrane protein [Prevotella sp.]
MGHVHRGLYHRPGLDSQRAGVPDRQLVDMMQTIIVDVILALTAFFAVRWLVRTLKGKGGGCGCGCQNCPYANGHCKKK